jgi:hypothetical protein
VPRILREEMRILNEFLELPSLSTYRKLPCPERLRKNIRRTEKWVPMNCIRLYRCARKDLHWGCCKSKSLARGFLKDHGRISNSIRPEVCRDGRFPPMRCVDPVLVAIVFFARLDHFDDGHQLPQVSYLGADLDSSLPTALPRRSRCPRDSV